MTGTTTRKSPSIGQANDKGEKKMKKITIGKMPQLPFEMSEAINQLRVNLSFCGSNVKTIMVTSSISNEGKSFVSMQLWRMIA